VISKADWDLRQKQWAEFNRLKRTEIRPEYSPEQVLGFISMFLEWIPESARAEERDPERHGVQRMHALLGAVRR